MPRLFFALKPDAAQAAMMLEATRPLLQELRGRPVIAADLHLTLCFLGEIAEAQASVLLATAEQIPPVSLQLAVSQLDFWQDSRVLCLMPEAGAPLEPVTALAARLRSAAMAAGLPVERRPFRAHVTVGRKIPSSAALARTWPLRLAEPLSLTADGFVLMGSTGAREGARYDVRRAWRTTTSA